MNVRPGGNRLLYSSLAAISALIAIAVLLTLAHAAPSPTPRPRLRGIEVFARGVHRAPHFALRDQYGHIITTHHLRGHIVALTFLDSRCRQECPIAGRELAAAQRRLGSHSPLTVVIISVDPKGDTPRSAETFVRHAGLHGRWYWLFGTRQRLAPVWRKYGIEVQPARHDVVHTAAVYLIDRTGSVRVVDGVPFFAWQLAESVRALALR